MKESAQNGTRQKPGDNQHTGSNTVSLPAPTLAEIGIGKKQSSDCQPRTKAAIHDQWTRPLCSLV